MKTFSWGISCQMRNQNFYFFPNRFVFVHDKHVAAFDLAQPTFNGYTGGPQILLGNIDFQLFSQIFKFLVNLFRFHVIPVPKNA